MSTRRTAGGSARGKRGIEWIGGTVAIPGYVTGEGEPFRPEALLWMGAADGSILGSTVAKRGEVLPLASDSLQAAIDEPIDGRPHRPTRVRVASAELADALRAGHPGLDVVCAPTPELDEVIEELQAQIAEDAEGLRSYLSPEIEPAAIASLFGAAAALYRAAPWKLVPADQSLISVTIDELGVHNAAITVMGQLGQSFGLILFASVDHFDRYIEGAEALQRGEEPAMPPHFAFTFDPGSELPRELRKEIAEHGWEVADASAHPMLFAIDEDLLSRPPVAEEVTIAEAIARALSHFVAEKQALCDAWDGGDPVSRTLSVPTHAGAIEVTLCAPYQPPPLELASPDEILAEFLALTEDGELDSDARVDLESELIRRFAESPEAKDLDGVFACHSLMDLAANYLGETIATLRVSHLREVLFELIPRKVSIQASEAPRMVETLRAFFTYLKREFALAQADACLRALGAAAVKKLEAALSDPSKFGMAKSFFMGGIEAGFDMQSREGIDAWMRSVQERPLPPSVRVPELGTQQPVSKQVVKAKKNKRKTARKARKKNR